MIHTLHFRSSDDVSGYLNMEYMEWSEKYSLSKDAFMTGSHIYTTDMYDTACDFYKIRSTKLGNWQFVASENVTYLERIV